MRFVLICVALFNVVDVGKCDGVTCNVGTPSAMTTQASCMACTTTTSSVLGITGTTLGCSATACTPSSTVACCSTNLCNTGTTNGTGNGVNCYDDLSGKGGSIKSGCAQCMRIATNLVFTTSVQQMCVSFCVPLDITVSKTTCCQTDLCNGATSVGLKGLVLPLLLALAAFVV